ncbi:MAG: MoxR family ATPase [Planctomycetota bacterium]|nr:MoxR family ATPase [Planctomycetota bacterium]
MAQNSPGTSRFLRQVGIIGADRIDAIILASLATEAPLLLIGPHGTAKSLLLTRITDALGLKFRHYNASLLNYDDLVGYPLPDANGELRFVETPASIWPAEAVLLDEISRCRPDMQNRCFPIIHERCIQGIPIARLKHRWAAMNPPPSDVAGGVADTEYLGSEPLDAALADRFPFVVEMPHWHHFSDADRLALIGHSIEPLTPEIRDGVRRAVEVTQEHIETVEAAYGSWASEYVHLVSKALIPMRIRFSARRGVMVRSAVIAVHAASWTLGARLNLDESAWIALSHAIPDLAWGAVIDQATLQLAHRKVCESIKMDQIDPRRLLCQEHDPVNRVFMALEIDTLPGHELSGYAADALASCPLGARHVLASTLANHPAITRINPAIAEQLAILVGELECGIVIDMSVELNGAKHNAMSEIARVVGEVQVPTESSIALHNLLLRLWDSSELKCEVDVTRTAREYKSMLSRVQERSAPWAVPLSK